MNTFFYALIILISVLPLAYVLYMHYIKKREPSRSDYIMIAFLGLILLFVIMDFAANLMGGNTIAFLVTDTMPSLYNEVNATITYPPTLSMEKNGTMGRFYRRTRKCIIFNYVDFDCLFAIKKQFIADIKC